MWICFCTNYNSKLNNSFSKFYSEIKQDFFMRLDDHNDHQVS